MSATEGSQRGHATEPCSRRTGCRCSCLVLFVMCGSFFLFFRSLWLVKYGCFAHVWTPELNNVYLCLLFTIQHCIEAWWVTWRPVCLSIACVVLKNWAQSMPGSSLMPKIMVILQFRCSHPQLGMPYTDNWSSKICNFHKQLPVSL